MKEVIIIGGGLSGLTCADTLLDKGFKVTILEKLPYLGGLASSFEHDKKRIPKHYHHIISHNKITLSYLKRFGLDILPWKKINVAIGVHGKISQITKIFGLMGFGYLSFYEKIRFGLFGLYAIFMMDPNKIPDTLDAKSWLNKFAGKAVTKKIFNQLYAKNKFNISLSRISAKQFANRLKEREVYDDYTYPKKGLDMMIQGLEKDIIKKGGKIIRSARIILADLDKRIVKFRTLGATDIKIIRSDVIVNTIPIPEFLKIASGLPDDYVLKLSKIRYCPAVGITFGTKDFLHKDIYWFNLFKERVHVIMQHSILADMYGDKVSWVLRYGGSEEDIGLSDEEIKKEYLGVVKKYFPDANVKWSYVFREQYGEPIYDKDYSNYMPDYTTPLKNLFMAGIQVTFPKIRNMNSALESGVEVAKIISDKFVGY